MASVDYTSRVVDVRYYTNTFDGDTWVNDPVEYQATNVLVTDETCRACGGTPAIYGQDFVLQLYYSGYISGVKTRIQLADALDVTACVMYLYEPLTGVKVADWPVAIVGETEETPIHGQLIVYQDIVESTPVYTVATAPGEYRFQIVYTDPTLGLISTIISGWIEILPKVPTV